VGLRINTAKVLHPCSLATPDIDPAVLHAQRAAGHAAAAALGAAAPSTRATGSLKRRTQLLCRAIYSGLAMRPAAREHQRWLEENGRLIAATVKELRQFAGDTCSLPAVYDHSRAPILRVCALAHAFLGRTAWHFDETLFRAFLHGVQDVEDLTLGEIWGSKPALQLALVERIVTAATTTGGGEIPVVINSLRALSDSRWGDVFADVNVVDPVLLGDPSASYERMDSDSQEQYRRMVSELSSHPVLPAAPFPRLQPV
jgi:hypothetical protein